MCNSMVGVGYLENWRQRDTSEDNLSRKDIELIGSFSNHRSTFSSPSPRSFLNFIPSSLLLHERIS